jgi:polyhydroxyalkanoate synthesis regulator phasin
MTKRVLTGFLALGLAFGAAACSKSIDKEGTVDNLVEQGVMTREQAQCTVDRIDEEFGDDDDVIDALSEGGNVEDLSEEDSTKLTEIVTTCLGVGGSTNGTDTTAAG